MVPILAAVLVYLVPWLVRFFPCEIRITEAGISMTVANHATWLKYKEIASCEIVNRGNVTVLAITTLAGQSWVLGVAPSVSIAELHRVVSEQGVEVYDPDKGADEGTG